MTRTERVAAVFRSRPGEWIDGLELATVGGQYAWRTRTADARKLLGKIENRQRRVTTPQGVRVISEYRYISEAIPCPS